MLISLLSVLDRALRDAGIPIESVSIGMVNGQPTRTAIYSASATPAQRAQGDALLATLDPQDPVTVANIKADYAMSQVDADVLMSLAQALWECIPAPTMTRAQLRARFIAILKTK